MHPIIFYLSRHDFLNPSQRSITYPLSYPLQNSVPDSAPTFQLKWIPSPLRSAPRRNCSMTIYINVTMRQVCSRCRSSVFFPNHLVGRGRGGEQFHIFAILAVRINKPFRFFYFAQKIFIRSIPFATIRKFLPKLFYNQWKQSATSNVMV